MDAVLPSTFEIQKHLCEVPCRKNGEHSFWHHEEHDLQQVPLQATYHEHQAQFQDIHHVHLDLEDFTFQDFGKVIVFGNGSDATTGSGSDDFLCILPMKPCLPVVAISLLVHHDNLISKASKGNHVLLFPEKIIGNNGK